MEKEMKPKLIPVLEDCIEVGLKLGMNRAYKHHSDPPESVLLSEQQEAIMNEIYERFDFKEVK
jgi:hypothetical protein